MIRVLDSILLLGLSLYTSSRAPRYYCWLALQPLLMRGWWNTAETSVA